MSELVRIFNSCGDCLGDEIIRKSEIINVYLELPEMKTVVITTQKDWAGFNEPVSFREEYENQAQAINRMKHLEWFLCGTKTKVVPLKTNEMEELK